jgi:hypothetical protein
MNKSIERIEALEQQTKRLTDAQGAQFTTILKRFDAIETRLTNIETSLASIQDVLHTVAAMIYKLAGDHPDSNHERFE